MKANNPIMRYLERNNLIEDFVTYGVYMRHTAGLSYFNAATLVAQRRGVGFAATETAWQNRFRREIKPGANPLVIVKPFAPLDLYFEACDTYSPEGRPLPEWVAEDSYMIPPMPQAPFALPLSGIIRLLNDHGIYYGEQPMGEFSDGLMRYSDAPLYTEAYHKHICVRIKTHYAMVVNAKKSDLEKAATIFHEIGHLLCGHLPLDEELKKLDWLKLSIPTRYEAQLSTEQTEFEAETACMLIMRGLGFQFDRAKYLDGYRVNGHAPSYSLATAVAAADQFLGWMQNDTELSRFVPHHS